MDYKAIKLPRGIKHSLWSVMDASLYPAIYLATVPVMLRSMGTTVFGLWIVLNSLVTILQLFNFNSGIANMAVATIRNFSDARAANDPEQVRDTINSALHITAFLFAIVSCAGFFLGYASVQFSWWGLTNIPGINVSACVELAAVIAGLKYFDQVFQSIIKAYEHFKISSILNMINRFGLLIINLAFAINKFTVLQILVADIVFMLLCLSAQFLYIKKITPSYNLGKIRDNTLYKRLLRLSVFPWLQSLIIAFTFQSDRFWVSSYAGLKEVSSYGLVSTMFNHIHMIFTAMAVWMLPRIAAMTSKGENPEQLYKIVRSCLFGFIVISLLLLYFIAPVVFRFWIGQDMYGQMHGYINSFVAFEIVFAHSILPFLYLNAAGKERTAVIATFIYCAVCYIFMLGGLWLFHSPLAMVAGMTLSLCLTMPVINVIANRGMDKSYSWKQAYFEMLPMYTAILLIYLQSNVWLYMGLAGLVLFFLWNFYLSNLVNKRVWLQLPKT